MASRLRLVTVGTGLALALVAPGSASAAVYGGQTSQSAPIVITVTKTGQVKSVVLMWDASCKSGTGYTFARTLTSAKKAPSIVSPDVNPLLGTTKKGKFKGHGIGSAVFGDQAGGAITHDIKGKFKPKTASGTFSGHMDVVDAEGNATDTCDTGTVRWKASRGPNVYGGFTTKGDPVVVMTNKARTKVDYLGIGWQGDCTPDGFLHLSESFGNFPLVASGGFGDKFTNEYPFDDGTGKNSYTFDVNGTVKKKKASGTMSVQMVATDNAGTQTATCNSETVRWSATQ
jgi:hypothetical protein